MGAWWKSKEPCPDGAVLKGQPWPRGENVWCGSASGVKHGPFTSWWDNGAVGNEGWYDRGIEHGVWRRWDKTGKLTEKDVWDRGQLLEERKY